MPPPSTLFPYTTLFRSYLRRHAVRNDRYLHVRDVRSCVANRRAPNSGSGRIAFSNESYVAGPLASVFISAVNGWRPSVICPAGAVTRTEFGRLNIGEPDSDSGRGGGSPRPEGFLAEDAKCAAGREMALEVESFWTAA